MLEGFQAAGYSSNVRDVHAKSLVFFLRKTGTFRLCLELNIMIQL